MQTNLFCQLKTAALSISCLLIGCADKQTASSSDAARRTIEDNTTDIRYPPAADPSKVGSYPALSKSGGGFFWDSVLEYRVWTDTDSSDSFLPFDDYRSALEWSRTHPDADSPLVLVLQLEHVNEPQPGTFEHVKGRRITEWRPQWLAGSHREPDTIDSFLASMQAR